MINPLCVATGGYISPFTKKRLEISVDGYLIETLVVETNTSGGGGGRKLHGEKRRRELKLEEDNVILIIKAFLLWDS